jgi:histidyl-tRNA synthetase
MAKTSATPYKGTRDFLPIDVRRRAFVTAKIRAVYESHGFAPLETPALERLDTLMGKYGEEGDQLLFKVLLRGQPLVEGIREASAHIAEPGNLNEGRSGITAPRAEPMLADVGLRYDLTVPLARVYAAYQGKLPVVFKRYQIQPVWRADTPGKGRFREFYQCDVDVCGSSSLLVEADVLAAAAESLLSLGFDNFELRLNHRALLRALVEQAGIDVAKEGDAITAVDKLDKIGADGVTAELEARGVAAEATKRLLALLSDENGVVGRVSLDRIAEAMTGHDNGGKAVAELREVMRLSQLTAAGKYLRFDLSLARGLGYYTGCIFEISVPDLGSSLGGGGRYDGLIGMFLGREVPACGLSLGLERILVVMEERKMYPESLGGPDAVLASVGTGDLDAALSLAQRLRELGVKIDLVPQAIGGGKVGKLRTQAETDGLPAAIWIEQGATSVWLRAGAQTLREQTAEQIAAAILGGSS